MDIGNFATLLQHGNARAEQLQGASNRIETQSPAQQAAAGRNAAGGVPQHAQAITLLSGSLASTLRKNLKLSDNHRLVLRSDPDSGEMYIDITPLDAKSGRPSGQTRTVPLDGRLGTVIARHREALGPLFDLSA